MQNLSQVEPSGIKGPLVQFQTTKSNKNDTRKLMSTINQALNERALPEGRLNEAFEAWWPELEQHLKKISDTQVKRKPQRDQREILEEILELTREQTRIIKSYDSEKSLLNIYYNKNFPSRLQYNMPSDELGKALETFDKVIKKAKRENKELASEEDKDNTAE